MLYLTPGLFRKIGTGFDLSGYADQELAFHLEGATRQVNRYCSAPGDHDFRGASVTNEQHPWHLGNAYRPGSGKIWPFHYPVKSVEGFRIRVTNQENGKVVLDPSSIYYHSSERSFEPIDYALRLSVFTAGFVPVLMFREPVAEVDYTYGFEFAEVDELAYAESSTVYRAMNQWWTDATVTVKVGGSLVASGYTIDRDEGTVTFDAEPASSNVELSYTHRLPQDILQATALTAVNLLIGSDLVKQGMGGLSALKAEEISVRFDTQNGPSFAPQVTGPAQGFLAPYRFLSWGRG